MQGGLGLGREVRREFWLSIRSGVERRKAALALGLNDDTGKEWFRQAGGVIPAYVTAQTSHRSLSLEEREEIFAGVERGDSIRRIARTLGRAPSTVFRELRRNDAAVSGALPGMGAPAGLADPALGLPAQPGATASGTSGPPAEAGQAG